MRRVLAIFTFLGLLAGGAPVWPTSGCCEEKECCKSGICPLHHPKHTASGQDVAEQDMHCHHAAGVPAPESAPPCRVAGECGHQAQALYSGPQLRAVLPAVLAAMAGRDMRFDQVVLYSPTASGFLPQHFEPPRLPAASSTLLSL